jgi:hypothetical protein
MRPSYLHVLTGLLLGLALAGLFHLPGRILSHQESMPRGDSPLPSQPGRDVVVHVSPKVERALTAARERRGRPRPGKSPKARVGAVPTAPMTSAPTVAPVVESPASVEPVPPTPEPTAPAPEPAPPPPPEPAPEPAPPPPPKVTVAAPSTPSPAAVAVGKPKHEKKPKNEKRPKAEKKPKAEKPQTNEIQPEKPLTKPDKPEKQDHGDKKGRDK